MVLLFLFIVFLLDMKIIKSCMMLYDDVRSIIVFFISFVWEKW